MTYPEEVVRGLSREIAALRAEVARLRSGDPPPDQLRALVERLTRQAHERAVGATPLFSSEHWKHNAGPDWPEQPDDDSYQAFENCQHPDCRLVREAALLASPVETCCEHPESAHETAEYRGDKRRHCLAAGCTCKRFFAASPELELAADARKWMDAAIGLGAQLDVAEARIAELERARIDPPPSLSELTLQKLTELWEAANPRPKFPEQEPD